MLFALSWYAVSGRKWFKGPKVNVEHVLNETAVERAPVDLENAEEANEGQRP